MSIQFRIEVPHGHLVGVGIPPVLEETARASLTPDERLFVSALVPGRQATWAAGRVALRAALGDAGVTGGSSMLPTDRGGPRLPPDAAGSISHKRELAVALAARRANDDGFALGVDLELDAPLRIDISRRVLTPGERTIVEGMPAQARDREILLRLSAKEAIYKALDPFVRRFVSFQEAEITNIRADGTAIVGLSPAQGEGPFTIDVRWLKRDRFLITTAKVSPR